MNPIANMEFFAAVVLAAGELKRMGSPKLILPWRDDTVIGRVVHILKAAGITEIVVVTGGASLQVEAALEGLGARTLRNPDYSGGEMLTSCQLGLQALSPKVETALVVLGDQPQIELGVVNSVLDLFVNDRAALVVPSYQMHRGHPWLVARALWPGVLALHPPETLRNFLIAHADQITYLPVETASILEDLDTPADYDRYSHYR